MHILEYGTILNRVLFNTPIKLRASTGADALFIMQKEKFDTYDVYIDSTAGFRLL